MATYTIYEPSARSCPVKFVSGNFWDDAEKFSLSVENVSGKPIQSLAVEAEQFLSPQYLHRPFEGHRWSSDQILAAGETRSLEQKAYPASVRQSVMGWVFLPDSIKFTDGSVWKAEAGGECFHIFWREKEHPQVEALPPLQMEMNVD